MGCVFEVKLEDFVKDTTKIENKQEYLLFYVVSMGFFTYTDYLNIEFAVLQRNHKLSYQEF